MLEKAVCSLEIDVLYRFLDCLVMEEIDPAGLAYSVYALRQYCPKIVDRYVEQFRMNSEWWASEWLWDEPELLYYLYRLGLGDCDGFWENLHRLIFEQQTNIGRVHSNCFDHTGPMRVMVKCEPKHRYTAKAVRYFVERYDELCPGSWGMGVLALHEYDPIAYKDVIERIGDLLLDQIPQQRTHIGSMIQGLAVAKGLHHPAVQEYKLWLMSRLEAEDWANERLHTAELIETLSFLKIGNGRFA